MQISYRSVLEQPTNLDFYFSHFVHFHSLALQYNYVLKTWQSEEIKPYSPILLTVTFLRQRSLSVYVSGQNLLYKKQ